jgi:co-chaperonin GroES (HSP10)
MSLPSEWIKQAIPLKDQLLVRRVRQGYIWQGIIEIPDSYIGFTKNANAAVIAIGSNVNLPELILGDIVWVAQGVTRKISFEEDGNPIFEPALYSCYPMEIVMNLGQLDVTEPIVLEDRSPKRFQQESGLDKALHDRRADEAG